MDENKQEGCLKFILAIIVCGALYAGYVALCVALNWRHAGGIFVFISFLTLILIPVWKAIFRIGKEKAIDENNEDEEDDLNINEIDKNKTQLIDQGEAQEPQQVQEAIIEKDQGTNVHEIQTINRKKHYKLIYLVYYLSALILSLAVTHFILKPNIKSSLFDIYSYLELIDTDCNIHYIAEDNIDFEYEKAISIPADPIYEGIKSLYIIKDGDPWATVLLERTDIDSFRYTRESPYAVGFNSKNGSSIKQHFNDFINFLHDEEVTNDVHNIPIIQSILIAKSKYHYVSPSHEESCITPLHYYSSCTSYTNTITRDYIICKDKAAIAKDYYLYSSIIFIVLSLILSIVLFYGGDNEIEEAEKGKAITESSHTDTNDERIQILLAAISPSNFVSPYDAEKIRIATDLYTALQENLDNEIIVGMIEVKAKELLGVIID